MTGREQLSATKRQDAAFRAYADTGSVKAAAHRLGLSERVTRRHLSEYCAAHSYPNLVQALVRFGQLQRDADNLL